MEGALPFPLSVEFSRRICLSRFISLSLIYEDCNPSRIDAADNSRIRDGNGSCPVAGGCRVDASRPGAV